MACIRRCPGGRYDKEAIELLLSAGADVNIKSQVFFFSFFFSFSFFFLSFWI